MKLLNNARTCLIQLTSVRIQTPGGWWSSETSPSHDREMGDISDPLSSGYLSAERRSLRH